MGENLYARFSKLAGGSRDIALIADQGGALRYAELDHRAARIGGALAAAGVTRGDRIAVKTEKSPAALALYLACLRMGAIYVPMNTAYTADETAYILTDCEPRLFVASPEERTDCGGKVLSLDAEGGGSLADAARAATARPEIAELAADDIATILYTSGTTGRPKGAMLSHENLGSNAATLAQAWRFTEDDILLHALPIFHAHGLFVAVNTSLIAGAQMIFLPRFDTGAVMRNLGRATVFMGVPTYYARLLDDPRLDGTLTQDMRLFVSGSAPLLPETFAAFETRTSHRILERYGMTETAMICSNPYEEARRPGTVGPPLAGIDVRVTDEGAAVLGTDEVGGLEVRGPNVTRGYWRRPEATADAFSDDGWFKTGDIAKIDRDGYVHLVGRAKDLIITGGFNVYPIEIEGELNRLRGIKESAVFGVPHDDFGEAVVAAVKADREIDETAVLGALKKRLAAYKVPKKLLNLDELPRNTMGKIEKARLRREYAELFFAQKTG